MTREVVLDTETTGLNCNLGDRIIEIGAIELISHVPTGKKFHEYINPEKDISDGNVYLKNKPVFKNIAHDFLQFIGESNLIIHNAVFDISFLNIELKRLGLSELSLDRTIDTLKIAKQKFPGSSVSLDSLCKRFKIDNTMRELHGALLDTEILAEVYLELLGGKQPNLEFANTLSNKTVETSKTEAAMREKFLPERISETDVLLHKEYVNFTKTNKFWRYS